VSKFVRLGLVAACLALLAATPVAAGAPTIERQDINVIGDPSDDLTALCHFAVWVDVTGHITDHIWTDSDGNLVREVTNYNLLVTYHSDNGSVFAVNVGPDRFYANADGSFDLYTTGNIESLHGPGNGNAYRDVGWTHIHITFDADGNPSFEFVDDVGAHYGDHDAVLCELLS